MKSLDKLPLHVAKAFRQKFKELAQDPYATPIVKKLTNPAFTPPNVDLAYRLRVGNYRAVFTIEDEVLKIIGFKVGPAERPTTIYPR